MIKAELHRQLMISVHNKVGSLAEISNLISQEGISFIALCAYNIEDHVSIMFVTDDNNAAKSIIENQGVYKIVEEEVILLTIDSKPGALHFFTNKLAESNVDLTLIYGGGDECGETSKLVLIAKDNLDAMIVIRTELARG